MFFSLTKKNVICLFTLVCSAAALLYQVSTKKVDCFNSVCCFVGPSTFRRKLSGCSSRANTWLKVWSPSKPSHTNIMAVCLNKLITIYLLRMHLFSKTFISLSPITSPIMKMRLMPQAMRSFLLAKRLVLPSISDTDSVTWHSCSCCRRPTRLETSSLHSDDESELFSSGATCLHCYKSIINVKGF